MALQACFRLDGLRDNSKYKSMILRWRINELDARDEHGTSGFSAAISFGLLIINLKISSVSAHDINWKFRALNLSECQAICIPESAVSQSERS